MQNLRIDPEVHLVRDIPFTVHIRKECREPDLMTYYHLRNKVWVVGWWICRSKGLLKEFLILGPTPASATRGHVREIRAMMFSTVTASDMIREVRGADQAHMRWMDDMQRMWDDGKTFIRRNLLNRMAAGHPVFQANG